MKPLGFGRKTGIDLEARSRRAASTEWKRSNYKRPEQQRWYAGETISLGIGQGYNNFTMLQLASATATLVSGGSASSRGWCATIEDVVTRERTPLASDALEPLAYKPEHVERDPARLHGVTQEGTSARVFAGAGYAQRRQDRHRAGRGHRANEKYNAAQARGAPARPLALHRRGADRRSPRVALAVVVENAGFGAAAAAPIARRVFDYLLLGPVPSEEDMAATREGKSGAPIGTPRRAADVPLPGQAPARRPAAPAPAAARRAAAGACAAGRRRAGHAAMSAVLQRPSPWLRLSRRSRLRPRLALAVGCLAAIGLVAMYSAGYDHGTRFVDHGRNMLLALAVLFVVAQVPPQKLQQLAVPLYAAGRGAAGGHGAVSASPRRAPRAGWTWAS